MTAEINRRHFVLLVGGVPLGLSRTAFAQTSMPLIGIVSNQTREAEVSRFDAIRRGLQETGFVEGRNFAMEVRYADGDNARLPELLRSLVGRSVSVIITSTTPTAIAAKAATSTIPIVFASGIDPVALGLVASLSRPGANITGVTFLVQQLVGKRMELLCDTVAGGAPIGMLAAARNPNAEGDIANAQSAAASLGRTLHVAKLVPDPDLEAAFAELTTQRIAAVFIAPHAEFRVWQDKVVALAMRHRLPTSFAVSDFVPIGGLMSYGPDQLDSYRAAGVYAGRILKGEKPADLPVLQSTKFEFAINLKTAKALGLTISPGMLAFATQVIE